MACAHCEQQPCENAPMVKAQRRLRWCGLAFGEKYHLATTTTPSSFRERLHRRRRHVLLAIVIFAACLLFAAVSLSVHLLWKQSNVVDVVVVASSPSEFIITTPPTPTLNDNEAVEFVVPLKQAPRAVFHETHDIIYDEWRHQQDNDPSTGHFRDSVAEVFDPHPEYVIRAFGRTFHLDLTLMSDAAAGVPPIIHLQPNRSHLLKAAPGGGDRTACDYVGRIRGEPHSFVRVSLCDGMTGYLKSIDGDFRIEPDEVYERDRHTKSSIRHRMMRLLEAEQPCGGHHDHDALTTTHEDDEEENEVRLRLLPPEKSRTRRSTSYYTYEHHDDDDDSGETYVIETLVVADRKMLEYHGNNRTRLTQYILTLMSHVALLFKDASVGNPITLVVGNILIVDDARVSFASRTSVEFLRKFCAFQHRHSDQRHDVALLFTRDLICKNPAQEMCTTLGLAEVGSMCSPATSCAVVRDKGLSTSFTVAHELGHVLSMPHDDDVKCRRFNNGTTPPNNIMAKSLLNDTQPWHWSACSKHHLTEFLSSAAAACIQPQTMIGDDALRPGLPGKTFAGDRQCELEFGAASKVCSFMPECATLWCTHDEELSGCQTQYMPWADGTPCANATKICLQGRCSAESSYRPVAGGWSAYTAQGECSRTCGGGVRTFHRECNRPSPRDGGAFCTGGSRRYESCNTQACAPGAADFRAAQCSRFDGNTKGLKGLTSAVRWVPKYAQRPADVCALYCRVDQSSAYYRLARAVLDGTECEPGGFAICVHGTCRPAGCDHVLGSNAHLDECGVCGGDNSTCRAITGFYDDFAYGYNDVVTIPRGASNIDIRQRGAAHGADAQYLVLRDAITGDYLLNGDSVISKYDKEVPYGGLKFRYSGGDAAVERITTARNERLERGVRVEVLQVGVRAPPFITYTYTLGTADGDPRYAWSRYVTEDCSSICSGRLGMLRCRSMATGDVVADEYCAHLQPSPLPSCNQHCYLTWMISDQGQHQCIKTTGIVIERVDDHHCANIPIWTFTTWSPCSVTCGRGERHRRVECQRGGQTITNEHCANLQKPPTIDTCQATLDCEPLLATWSTSNWSACSGACGSTHQLRTVSCVDAESHRVPEKYCQQETPPPAKQICARDECEMKRWRTSDWSACSTSCGRGTQTRHVYCEHVAEARCARSERPVNITSCQQRECAAEWSYEWHAGRFGRCSTQCGVGERRRDVACIGIIANGRHKLVEQHCEQHLRRSKPATRKPCARFNCAFAWLGAEWTSCSATCDAGTRRRRVDCFRVVPAPHRVRRRHGGGTSLPLDCPAIHLTNHTSPSQFCSFFAKPPAEEECSIMRCGDAFHWKTSPWRGCDASHNRERRRVVCLDSEKRRRVADEHCLRLRRPKPRRQRPCTLHQCPPDVVFHPQTCREVQLMNMSLGNADYQLRLQPAARLATVYCYKMDTDRPEEFITLPAGEDNFSEQNMHQECVDDASSRTWFWKVRLDVLSMRIQLNDWTFARYEDGEGGVAQPFATASDCCGCMRARFRVNLTRTTFRLADDVHWVTREHSAKIVIRQTSNGRVVSGTCDGCAPHPDVGLKLEVT